MAATHDLTKWTSAHKRSQTESPYKVNVLTGTIDCADYNIGSGDTVQLLNVPANALVLSVRTKCVTAEGGTLTVDVGDDGSGNRYGNDLNMNTTTDNVSAASAMYLYPAANTIDVLFNNAADVAVIQVQAILVDLN
jgi:hypothetical protein